MLQIYQRQVYSGEGEKRQLPVWLFKIKDTRRNYHTSRKQKGLTAEGNCSGDKNCMVVFLFNFKINDAFASIRR